MLFIAGLRNLARTAFTSSRSADWGGQRLSLQSTSLGWHADARSAIGRPSSRSAQTVEMALSCPRPRDCPDDRDGPVPDLAAYYAPAQRASELKRAVEEGAIAGRTAAASSRWRQAEVRQNDASGGVAASKGSPAVALDGSGPVSMSKNSPALTASTQRWPHETRAGTPSRSSRLRDGLIRCRHFRCAVSNSRSDGPSRQSRVIDSQPKRGGRSDLGPETAAPYSSVSPSSNKS